MKTDKTKKIRWGIIGCGDVTEVKSGPAFQKVPHSELVAVMRRDGAKAKDYSRRHGVARWYDNADRLINDPEVDAVYIATPPDSHSDYTIKVAAAGKPVYVEKPMARCYRECLGMIAACEKANVPLFTAYYRRSLPKFLKVKELLGPDHIGEIRTVQVLHYIPAEHLGKKFKKLPWRVIPEISGGGHFVDLASHTIDLLHFFFGQIITAKGIAANQMHQYPAEDIVSAIFHFEKGIIGSAIWCFTSYDTQDIIEIVGSRGKIIFSVFTHDPIRLFTEKNEQKTWTFERPEHIQQPHIQTVVKELLGKGKCPSNGYTAAHTNRVIDEILKDWRETNKIKFKP
jgi:predicted dehydrogenase